MSNVNFFTPISFGNQNKNTYQSLLESVDSYFFLAGKKACVIDIKDPQKRTVLLKKSPSLLATCLKVTTYLTLIIPLLLILTKLLLRSTSTYTLDHDLQQRLPHNPELCDYYEKQGILRNDTKPIPIDITDTLGLDLEETLTLDQTIFNDTVRPLLPQTPITLRQATVDVITQINETIYIGKQQNPDSPIADVRQVRLNTQGPWYKSSSNLAFYCIPEQQPDHRPFPSEKPLWLNRIITALESHHHIFQIQFPNNHGYYLQA